MTPKRGTWLDDVGSMRLFRGAELSDVELPVGSLSLLALLLFLGRHADSRALVVVREEQHPDEHQEEGDDGS